MASQNLGNIDEGYGFKPIQCHAITWMNADL